MRTETALEPGELQDFMENLSEVLKAAAGMDLTFTLRLEVATSPEQVAKLSEALKKARSSRWCLTR